jgi:hypothetical protein
MTRAWNARLLSRINDGRAVFYYGRHVRLYENETAFALYFFSTAGGWRRRRAGRRRGTVYSLRMMQLGTWVLSTVCGSMGVFSLWFVHLTAAMIPYAIGFLCFALGLEFANRRYLAEPRR